MTLACTHADVFAFIGSSADKCAVISSACESTQSLFNFYKFYYCHVNNPWAMAVILCLIIFSIFVLIYEIVDEYMVPAVLCIVKTLRMSDALAGVTLLAFANGAGDVITALVASGTEEAVSYNIGGVVGAGLFVVSVVVFLTAELSPRPIVLPSAIICRDLPVYALALGYILLCGAKGKIAFYDAMGIIALYFCIVIAVMVQERGNVHMDTKRTSLPLGGRSEEEELEGFISGNASPSTTELTHRKSLKHALRSFSLTVRREEEAQQLPTVDNWAMQAVNALDFPLRWARRLTIPPCNEEIYSRRLLSICPFVGLPFLLWGLGIDLHWPFYLPVALTLAFALNSFAPQNFGNDSIFSLVLSVAGALMGVLWTKIVSELLIDSLNFIGLVANLSTTYLGLTIIAIGSALPDAITTVALAKNGQAALGLTGGYAGQIFGLLVGFGSSMAKKTYLSGKAVRFELFRLEFLRANLQLLLVLGTAVITIVSTIIWGLTHGYRLEKRFGRSLCLIYIVFFSACTVVSAIEAYKTF